MSQKDQQIALLLERIETLEQIIVNFERIDTIEHEIKVKNAVMTGYSDIDSEWLEWMNDNQWILGIDWGE